MTAILDLPEVRRRISPLTVEEYHRLSEFNESVTSRMLLYGSSTRDASGGHYLVGMGPGYHPIVLRIQEESGTK